MKYRNKNMMKRGFTLVELAIVLVIIGILIGLAIKGSGLMEVAKVKADINKLRKISAGLAQYELLYGKAPGYQNPEIFDNLTSTGILSENDFKISTLSGKYWSVMPCVTDSLINEGWVPVTGRDNQYACAYITDTPPSGSNVASMDVPAKFLCYIETIYDDKNWLQGDGRTGGALKPDEILTNIPDWDCSKASEENTKTIYLYRVF